MTVIKIIILSPFAKYIIATVVNGYTILNTETYVPQMCGLI